MSKETEKPRRRRRNSIIQASVLPGEPTDGSGRVCIHLFVQDERGPFVEPHVLHQAKDEDGQPIKRQLVALATRGRLACDRKRLVAPTTRNGVTKVTCRSNDPRAVTCPWCMATDDYRTLIKLTEQE